MDFISIRLLNHCRQVINSWRRKNRRWTMIVADHKKWIEWKYLTLSADINSIFPVSHHSNHPSIYLFVRSFSLYRYISIQPVNHPGTYCITVIYVCACTFTSTVSLMRGRLWWWLREALRWGWNVLMQTWLMHFYGIHFAFHISNVSHFWRIGSRPQ